MAASATPSFGVSYQTGAPSIPGVDQAGLWPQLHREVLDRLGAAGELDWSAAILDAASVRAKGEP